MAKQDLIIKEVTQLSSHPSSPDSGYSMLYPKTDGEWYVKNSDGTVKQVTNQTGLILEDDAFLYSVMF